MRFPSLEIFEILFFMVGLLASSSGRLSLPRRRVLEGRRARTVGALLMIPLPLSFTAGLLMGALNAERPLPASALALATSIEAWLLAVFTGAAAVCAYAPKPHTRTGDESQRPPPAPSI